MTQIMMETPSMIESQKKGTPRHIHYGLEFGHLLQGYNLKDYIQEAVVLQNGYETVAVDGVQRSGKSNCSMQISKWAKEATLRLRRGDKWMFPGWDNPDPIDENEVWELVLTDMVYKTDNFVNTVEPYVDALVPLDSLVWDDLNVHFTNTEFKINPQEYSAIDSTFTAIGTACKVIIINIPNITRLAKNIKDNVTFEIFIGKNRKRMMKRIFRLPGTKRMEMNLFKIDVEPPSDFDLYKIPKHVWDRYERRRRELAKEALQTLKSVTNMNAMDGFVTLIEAVKICNEQGLPWGIQSIQQMASRQVFPKQLINGKFCVEEEGFMEVLKAEKEARESRKRYTHT